LVCREVQVNLAHRWCCKLDIEDTFPDHSAFSRARNGAFREGVFSPRACLNVSSRRALRPGLVDGEGFAVDARLIQADANEQRSIARRDRDPARSSRAGERVSGDPRRSGVGCGRCPEVHLAIRSPGHLAVRSPGRGGTAVLFKRKSMNG